MASKPTVTEIIKIFSLPVLLMLVMLFLSKTPQLETSKNLGYAIIADMVLTIPLLYFLLIRKRNISNLTVLTFSVLGLFLAGWMLPKDFQALIGQLKSIFIPVIELFIISSVLYKIYKFKRSVKEETSVVPDALQLLRKNINASFSNKFMAGALVTELSVLYYGFLSWKKIAVQPGVYTNYKESGAIAIYGALILVIIAETIGFHFLLNQWSSVVAWIFTGSSIYLLLQLFAHCKALLQRPISLEKGFLIVRYGIFMDAKIPLASIESIEKTTADFVKEKGIEKVALLGDAESHNILLILKNEETLTKAYGTRKLFKKLYFYVDEPDHLIGTINERCLKKLRE
ncbi:hypothetical protein ACJD0Z_16220 [Flavobacteriaceae bacterium M23B6Z8]